jgi:2-polyprenyl-3-methyl-5-hydroxy-6-metoxy-1,4-benzoquinol methylase
MSLAKGAWPYEVFYRLGIHRLTWHRDAPLPEVRRWHVAGELGGKSVLEIGGGLASNAIWLAQQGLRAAVVDFAPRAIALARRRADRLSVALDARVVDVTRGDPTLGRFDMIVDCECLQDLKTRAERELYATSVTQWLAPGGKLVVASWLHRTPAEAKAFFPLARLADDEVPSLFPTFHVEENDIQRQKYFGVSGWHTVLRVRAPAASEPATGAS